jgi:regulatory protein
VSTITALRMQPGGRRRIGLYVDGVMRLAVSPQVAAGLSVGQAVEDGLLSEIEGRESLEAAVRRAGRLLSHRPRSEAELRATLQRAGTSPEAVEAALERLKGIGQINDDLFAAAWLENRAAFRPRSALALRAELQRKGVARDVIDRALAAFSEDEAALAAARRAARRWRAESDTVWRQRLYGYLLRRGFGHETISAAVRRVAAEAAALIESEGES